MYSVVTKRAHIVTKLPRTRAPYYTFPNYASQTAQQTRGLTPPHFSWGPKHDILPEFQLALTPIRKPKSPAKPVPVQLPPIPLHTPQQLKRLRALRVRLENKFFKSLRSAPPGEGIAAFLANTPECPRAFVTTLCNTAFRKFETQKQFDKMLTLFLEMEKLEISKDQKTYTITIPMFAKKQLLSKNPTDTADKEKALSLFREMTEQKVPLNMAIYNTILYIYNKLGDSQSLENTFQEINEAETTNPAIKPNRSTFGQVIDYYTKSQNVDRALHYYEVMTQQGLDVTLSIYNYIINMFADMKQLSRAIPLFVEMRDKGIADVVVYNLWIEVYASQGKHLQVMELFNEMHKNRITHDVTTYNLVLDVCGQRQERTIVEDLFKEMKVQRLTPDTMTYTALIAMYSTLDPDKAMATLDEMKGYGIPAIARTYNSLIEMYVRMRWSAKVLYLFEEMQEFGVKPDVHTYALIINVFRITFRRAKAIDYYERMLAEGIEPNQRVNDLMVKVRVKSTYEEEE